MKQWKQQLSEALDFCEKTWLSWFDCAPEEYEMIAIETIENKKEVKPFLRACAEKFAEKSKKAGEEHDIRLQMLNGIRAQNFNFLSFLFGELGKVPSKSKLLKVMYLHALTGQACVTAGDFDEEDED